MNPGVASLLFIGPDHGDKVGGRENLARLHRQALAEMLGSELHTLLLPKQKLSGWEGILATISGRINGVTAATEAKVVEYIRSNGVKRVWLDGSNLGVLARAIKRQFPKVEVLTFFHNVEPRFFWGAFRHKPNVRALGILAATFVAERHSVRYSDRLVALNRRDAEGIRRWHGQQATDLLPMAITDTRNPSNESAERAGEFMLFVGGSFYANRAGIAWFAREVAPHVAVNTLVIGTGMETQRSALEAYPNIKVIGRVEDLTSWYRGALAVIAPIFDGSGMKTKMAEALMHGKLVIGTREAFTGYEQHTHPVGWRANTPAEWIAAIERAKADPPLEFDPLLRRTYEECYSAIALKRGIAIILRRTKSLGQPSGG